MSSGLYHLALRLPAPVTTRIGALGTMTLPAGWYVYTGSGGLSLERRVARHFRKDKPLRWHIDYLTTRPDVRVVCAAIFQVKSKKEKVKSFGGENGSLSECEAHRLVGRLVDGVSVVARFGSGDCKDGCSSHLWWAGRDDVVAILARLPGAEIVTPPDRSNPDEEDNA